MPSKCYEQPFERLRRLRITSQQRVSNWQTNRQVQQPASLKIAEQEEVAVDVRKPLGRYAGQMQPGRSVSPRIAPRENREARRDDRRADRHTTRQARDEC